MTLDFEVEWLDAPGIEDVIDREAWARLVLRLDDNVVLTQCLDQRTRQARLGIYGSVFPLARWLVSTYWSLLYETRRVPRLRAGRQLARVADVRPWLRRHNLLTAREGYALPDVSIARDGDKVVLCAFPDPPALKRRRPVTFLHSGVHRLDPAEVDAGITGFIDSVLERLRNVEHRDVRTLKEDWEAILASKTSEPEVCQWAARLGLDPYDPDELTPDAETLLATVRDWSSDLRTDLLDAANTVGGARAGYQWIADVHVSPAHLSAEASIVAAFEPQNGTAPAYEVGYRSARILRRDAELNATSAGSIVGMLADRYGFPFQIDSSGPPPPGFIDGLLIASAGVARIVGPDFPDADRRFRWGRALYLWQFPHGQRGPRLISRGHARIQRESRAFAAELLAPAAAIQQRLAGGVVGDEEITELAANFNVRPLLIRHQIENHGLAVIE